MSENESTAIQAASSEPKAPVRFENGVAQIESLDGVWRLATMIAASSLAPKSLAGKPEDVAICLQHGAEVGLSPMQSIQSIASINGRPSIYGEAIVGLIRSSGLCEWWREGGDDQVGWAETHRKGDPKPIRYEFTAEMAKRANLWGKGGPWSQYPDRMLRARARGFLSRDVYPDVLKGMISAEEARDMPPDYSPSPSTPDPLTPGRHTLKAEPRRHVANQTPPEDDVIDVDAKEIPASKEPEQVEVTLKGVEPDPEPDPPASEPPFDNSGPTFDDCVNAATQREEIDGPSEAAQFVNTYLRKVLKKGDRDATPEDYQGIIDKLASPNFKPGLYLV